MPRPAELRADAAAETAERRFWHEPGEGLQFLQDHRGRAARRQLGLVLGAMLTGVV